MPSFTRRSQGYLDAARERVMIQDGSVGVSLQQRNLTADDFGGPQYEGCPDYLVFTRPDVIADLHRSFLAVRVDVIITDPFGGLPATLGESGLADRAEELNRTAASLAREVVSGSEAWVAGSVGPGTRFPSLGNIG